MAVRLALVIKRLRARLKHASDVDRVLAKTRMSTGKHRQERWSSGTIISAPTGLASVPRRFKRKATNSFAPDAILCPVIYFGTRNSIANWN